MPMHPPVHKPGESYPQHGPDHRRPRRPGKFRRFIRMYFMLVGAATTLYFLVRLLVLLFVEIAQWL